MMPPKKIFVIAGEESGDIIGADLLQQIRQEYPDSVIAGIGGARMEEAGAFRSIFPLRDLSVMGLIEVVRHLPRLIDRIGQTKKAVAAFRPDLLLTIDAPDFCLRIAEWTKANLPETKTLHTVAPSVWAWRAGRAKKIARFLDGLLCLLPFEPPYFTAHHLAARFIGHPLVHIIPQFDETAKREFYARHALDAERPVLCLLPGSRTREIEALLPVFLDTAARLHTADPALQIILPTLPHLAERVRHHVTQHKVPVIILPDRADKYVAMQSGDVALHASGTVALELALCATPMVTAYRMSAFSVWLARRLLKIKQVNLVNILSDRIVVPEYIQETCTADHLTLAVAALLQNGEAARSQRAALHDVQKKLRAEQPAIDFIKTLLSS